MWHAGIQHPTISTVVFPQPVLHAELAARCPPRGRAGIRKVQGRFSSFCEYRTHNKVYYHQSAYIELRNTSKLKLCLQFQKAGWKMMIDSGA
jgi:hypothetical protein